ncbi:hypothetical protein PMIN01_10284 [Paraphaeosphaeria minitans]|uniref:Uncharacterized protein n=1 Tax=Paraphaeosphaeria minitans TaxID=565426 RepID=A0A9P6G8W3_9PLEO|nr:hypothetical protein PMIN01_10284 [Paraphaeosphaeria minitans]
MVRLMHDDSTEASGRASEASDKPAPSNQPCGETVVRRPRGYAVVAQETQPYNVLQDGCLTLRSVASRTADPPTWTPPSPSPHPTPDEQQPFPDSLAIIWRHKKPHLVLVHPHLKGPHHGSSNAILPAQPSPRVSPRYPPLL